MKKCLYKSVVCLFLLTVTNSCYKDEISELQSRLDTQENSSIPTINQQISSMSSTIGLLQEADKDIKGLISNLQNTATELQRSLNSANSKIDENRTEITGLLNELRSTTDGKLAEINQLIQYLEAKDENLSKQIISVHNYVDGKSLETMDWATATFATLEQYDSLTIDLAAIKVSIQRINNSITELEERVNAKISADISQAMTDMSETLNDSISIITKAYSDAIAIARKEVIDSNNAAILSAISESETSMKSWVNEQLKGYYTIAEADAKSDAMMITVGTMLNAQKSDLESLILTLSDSTDIIKEKIDSVEKRITQNESAITSLKLDLAKQKSEMTEAYTEAIKTAINDLDGKLDSITEAKVVAINKSIVDGINGRLEALEKDVVAIKSDINNIFSSISTINTKIATLAKRIQSMLYIPEFNDGTVPVRRTNTNLGGTTATITFKVSPKDAIDDLDITWKQTISMKAFGTMPTRSAQFTDMPIVSYVSNKTDGTISIIASGVNLEPAWTDGVASIKAFVSISDGNTSFDTQLVELVPTISANAVDLGLSVLWSDCNYHYLTPYKNRHGIYPTSEEIYYNCDEGWRIPTIEEWQELNTLPRVRSVVNEIDNTKIDAISGNGNTINLMCGSYWTSTFVSEKAVRVCHTAHAYTDSWYIDSEDAFSIIKEELSIRLVKDK